MTLIERLDRARARIEKSYKEKDHVDIAKCCKNLELLYKECYDLGPQTKEYHYAEYLRLLMMHFYSSIFDMTGEANEIYEDSQTEKWKAGLIANKYSGKFIDEKIYA